MKSPCEHYIYLREPVAESSQTSFSGIPLFAQSRLSLTAKKSSCSASEMESFLASQSGATCGPSTGDRGEDELTSSRAASPAKASARQRREETMRQTCGRKCSALWETCGHGLFSARTSAKMRSARPKQTLRHVAIKRSGRGSMRRTWAQTILGNDFGYLPTPTATANWDSPSMAKWPCCLNAQRLFGRVSPTSQEWLMGWPARWTALERLGTDKFQSWLQLHSGFFAPEPRRRTP